MMALEEKNGEINNELQRQKKKYTKMNASVDIP